MNVIKDTVEALCANLPYFQGLRHKLTLAISGWLRKRGFSQQEVETIIRNVASHFNDDEIEERIHNIQTTFQRPLDEVVGWTLLMEIVGEDIAHVLDTKIPKIFLYTDEASNPLFRVLRWDTPNGKKFHTQHWNGESWVDGLGNTRKVLYRLPEIIKAVENGQTVFVVEGEKAVHAMEKLGFTATTNPFGAGAWLEEYSKQLVGAKEVIILPDNDKAGKKHAEKVAQSLQNHNIPARIVELPGLAEGEDVADLVMRREIDRERLLELVRESNRAQHILIPVLPLAQAVEKAKQLGDGEWIISNLLPARGLSILAGRPKFGKTELLLKIVADVITGADTFGRETTPVKVLWLTQEDSVLRLAEGLLRYGLDPSLLETHIFVLDYTKLRGALRGTDIITTAKELGTQLVFVEPLAAIEEIAKLGRKGRLTYEAIYDVLLPLGLDAKNHGISLVGVVHAAKGKSTIRDVSDVTDAPIGSTSYSAIADSVLAFGLPPNAKSSAERRLMAAGRDVHLDALLKWTGSQYVEVDGFELHILTHERRQILEALAHLGRATPTELSRYLEKNLSTTKWLLIQLKDEGLVVSADGTYELSKTAHEILKL